MDNTLENKIKNNLFAITGESGSGKTTAQNYIEQKYIIRPVINHTNRKPRFNGEKGYIFHLDTLDFINFYNESIDNNLYLAHVDFGKYQYISLLDDLNKNANTFVMTESGVETLDERIKLLDNSYNLISIKIIRDKEKRYESLVKETNSQDVIKRINRDKGQFYLENSFFDEIIINNGSLSEFYKKVDSVITKYI